MKRWIWWIGGGGLLILAIFLYYLRNENASREEYAVWLKFSPQYNGKFTYEEFKALKRIDGLSWWRPVH